MRRKLFSIRGEIEKVCNRYGYTYRHLHERTKIPLPTCHRYLKEKIDLTGRKLELILDAFGFRLMRRKFGLKHVYQRPLNFKAVIRQDCESRQITYRHLHELTGLPKATCHRYLKSDMDLTGAKIDCILDALGFSLIRTKDANERMADYRLSDRVLGTGRVVKALVAADNHKKKKLRAAARLAEQNERLAAVENWKRREMSPEANDEDDVIGE